MFCRSTKVVLALLLILAVAGCTGQPGGTSPLGGNSLTVIKPAVCGDVSGYVVEVQPDGSNMINADEEGVDCGDKCSVSYNGARTVVLEAPPGGYCKFEGWEGCEPFAEYICSSSYENDVLVSEKCGNVINPLRCRLVVDSPKVVKAKFTPFYNTLDVFKAGEGSGKVTSVDALVGWECPGDVTGELCKEVELSSSKGKIDCGDACTAKYEFGQNYYRTILTASPGEWSEFDSWDCPSAPYVYGGSKDPVCILDMNSNYTVTANFRAKDMLFIAVPGGNGRGTVLSSDGAINCGVDCAEGDGACGHVTDGSVCTKNYNLAKSEPSLTLTAVVGENSVFKGWVGCTPLPNDPMKCTISLKYPITYAMAKIVSKSPTWNYEFMSNIKRLQNTSGVYTYIHGNGLGTITSDDGKIKCTSRFNFNNPPGETCNLEYPTGEFVTLKATPKSGSKFDGWTGKSCLYVSDDVCVIPTVRAIEETGAMFRLTDTAGTYKLTIVKSGVPDGEVIDTDEKTIDCGYDNKKCEEFYLPGTEVGLDIFYNTDRYEDRHLPITTGCDVYVSKRRCTLVMDRNRTVTVNFTTAIRQLVVNPGTCGTDIVSQDDDKEIVCGTGEPHCTAYFLEGTKVVLGQRNCGWENCPKVLADGNCEVTMDSHIAITAKSK